MTNEELVALIQAGDHVQDNMGLLYQQNRPDLRRIHGGVGVHRKHLHCLVELGCGCICDDL